MPSAAPRSHLPMKGITSPPFGTASDLLNRNRGPKSDEPILIRVMTWYLFLRAGCFFLISLLMSGSSGAWIATFFVSHVHLFVRRLPESVIGPGATTTIQQFITTLCLLLGVIYSVVAWKWVTRFWLARWAMMFVSGATAIKILIGVLLPGTMFFTIGSVPIPDSFTLSSLDVTILIANVCINAAICFYLMFYPGVEKAFEHPFQ